MAPLRDKPTKQPDMRPFKLPPSTKRGGGYGNDLHDTGNSWLHGGRGEDHPNFDAKKPKLRKWP
jgi:hypothetical protein